MCLARPRERPEAQGRRAEGRPGPDPPSSSPPALSAESKAPAASGRDSFLFSHKRVSVTWSIMDYEPGQRLPLQQQ